MTIQLLQRQERYKHISKDKHYNNPIYRYIISRAFSQISGAGFIFLIHENTEQILCSAPNL